MDVALKKTNFDQIKLKMSEYSFDVVLPKLIQVVKSGDPTVKRSDSKTKSFKEVLASKRSFEGEDNLPD